MSLTYIFVVNRYKDINSSLHSKQPQTEEDQQLEEDVAAGPHVGNEQADFLPEPLPGRLVLFSSAQKALRQINTLNTSHSIATYVLKRFWLFAEMHTVKRSLYEWNKRHF